MGAEVPIDSASSIFSPIVTATCKAGQMTIKVETLSNFVGVVQSRDHKIPRCSAYGENSKVTLLRVNMLAEKDDPNYCGVFTHKESEEYSIAIAIRVHKTLQTAKDKFYMITCGKAGFQNTRNETSVVNLEVMDAVQDKAIDQVTYGRPYRIRAHFSRPDGKFGMKVKRCFIFSDSNNTVQLVDERGCPDPSLMSDFKYSKLQGLAEAKLYSMFKFPQSNRVHFQCDVLVCKGPCAAINCEESIPEVRSLADPQADALVLDSDDGALMASYSVFVLEPGQETAAPFCSSDLKAQSCDLTEGWLFWLCLVFGVLFFVLLIFVLFMLSAVTCSCVSEEVERRSLEKNALRNNEDKAQPHPKGHANNVGTPQEFHPYAKSLNGSQYGSRSGLNVNSKQSNNLGMSHGGAFETNSSTLSSVRSYSKRSDPKLDLDIDDWD